MTLTRTVATRPGAALLTATALLIGVGGLLLAALTLPAPGEGTPPNARAWLAFILALLAVGAFGVRGAAQGESRAARTLPASTESASQERPSEAASLTRNEESVPSNAVSKPPSLARFPIS